MAKKKRDAKVELPDVVLTSTYDIHTSSLISPGFLSQVRDASGPQATIGRRQFQVLWDTGASGSSIDKSVVRKLALRPINRVDAVSHAYGVAEDVNVYAVNFALAPDQPGRNIQVIESRLDGFDMLVGMDVITLGDFVVTRHEGRVRMTFRVPSMGNFDFIEEFDKQVARSGESSDFSSYSGKSQSQPRSR